MSEKIRVGIIGAGRMAYWHLKGYQKLKGVEIAGIVGQTRSNIEKLQRKFKISHGYTDYREMLEKQKLDAVNVTTPTYTHCPIVVDSLRAGCHVLCEKPMAMNLDEADRMIQAERESGKIIMLGFSQRFYKEFVQIKKLIDQGELGKIKVAWFRRGIDMPPQKWYSDKEKSSGVTGEVAIHAIDWLCSIMNSKVVRISAELTEHADYPGIDDNMWMILKFENGALGVVGASYTFPYLKRDIGIIGDKRALTVERSKVVVEEYGSHSLGMLVLRFIRYSLILPYWLFYNPFEKEVAHFISCLRTGSAPVSSSEDGRVSLAIALKAVESARSGKKIHVSL
jgi:UDP-N-acetylglucosamine 3-dehydrogenase